MIIYELNKNNVEGSGRDIFWRIFPAFTWRDWGKPRKTSGKIACLRAEIWTRDISHTKQHC
jgi:hypothetical protein